jgi:hypothetical protein
MPQYDEAQHTWVIKNAGEGDLELWLEGKPTCSCTIAKLEHGERAVVKPGQSTTIDLAWKTKDFHRNDFSQGATIGTNDPNRPVFYLTVKGQVAPAIGVLPSDTITFPSPISNEETQRARVAIISHDRPQMKLTKWQTSKPGLIVAEVSPMTSEETKQLKIDGGQTVKMEILPGMPQGRFLEEVVIQTDHPKQPEVKVRLSGIVVGPISMVPAVLRANVSGRQGGSESIILLVRGGRETQFEVVRHPDKVQVQIEPDGEPAVKGRYRMTVSVPKGTSPGEVLGEIVLKTDHPKVSEVKIPVKILISSGTDSLRF